MTESVPDPPLTLKRAKEKFSNFLASQNYPQKVCWIALGDVLSRIAIANAFQAKNPSLSKEQSLLAANVSLQIVRGMITLYGEADPKGKVLVVAEFKRVLTLYLGSVLSDDGHRRGKTKL